MVRDISSATQAEANQEQNVPIELYQIYLDDTTTLYLAVWPHSLDFYDENGNSQTYDPAAITRRPVNRSKGMDVDRMEVSLDNVNQEWSAYAANYDLAGVKVVIWKVFLERVSGDYQIKSDWGDQIHIFTGEIKRPKIGEQQISVQVKSLLDTIDKRLPSRVYASKCQWVFGSDECGVTPPTSSGIIQSMNASQDVITLENYSDTNWVHGSLETGQYIRMITDYTLADDTVTLEFALPTDVEVGDSYKITAGCSKVKDDADEGCQFWNNRQYFGGFPQIPEIRNIRQ